MKAISTKLYFVVWAVLLVLLLATWGMAQLNLRPFNAIVAMTIALLKMVLIILYFMHVRFGERLTWVFSTAAILWLLILVVGFLNDYFTRDTFVPGK